MSNNILFVVEGEKTESAFFKQLGAVFSLQSEIYCLKTNIYTLYKKMKEMNFNGDIKEILTEIHPEKRTMLSKRFAYTYLIFDFDAHHSKATETRTFYEIIADNIVKLKEMAGYFTDETDPSVGRLYINYPMMESFRDCNSFFDEDYENTYVPVEKIKNYKIDVGKKQLCRKHIKDFTQREFLSLMLQNIYKLNKLSTDIWAKPNYEDYLFFSQGKNVLLNEEKLKEDKKILSVLNTSLFIPVDYFGNREQFYDKL